MHKHELVKILQELMCDWSGAHDVNLNLEEIYVDDGALSRINDIISQFKEWVISGDKEMWYQMLQEATKNLQLKLPVVALVLGKTNLGDYGPMISMQALLIVLHDVPKARIPQQLLMWEKLIFDNRTIKEPSVKELLTKWRFFSDGLGKRKYRMRSSD